MRASRSGDWEEAVAQFRTAVELAPEDVNARLDLSLALARTGDLLGALDHAREAARRGPKNARAQSLVRELSAAVPVAPAGKC